MHLVFYKTTDVFIAEEKLNECLIKAEIVPTPVQDKAYCGVCVKVSENSLEQVEAILSNLEYQIVK